MKTVFYIFLCTCISLHFQISALCAPDIHLKNAENCVENDDSSIKLINHFSNFRKNTHTLQDYEFPFIPYFVPTITATKTVQQVGTDNGPAGPSAGDILEYTIVVSNTGTMDALDVNFTDILDLNTTLVPNSLQCSPIAFNDSYNVYGNVQINVPAASGMLINDINPCGLGSLSVTGINTSGTQGNVTFMADGSFSFNPAPGFTGTTSFVYTVTNGSITNTGTVTLTVAGMIWFINNNVANGDGRLTSPFNSVANFNTGASGGAIGDIIFMYRQTATNYSGAALTLKNNQFLIGQGASSSITAITGLVLPAHSLTLPATGGTNPVLSHNATTITLASGNQLHGLNVENTAGTGILGTSVGNLRIRDLSINSNPGTALDIQNGTLDVIISSLSASLMTTGFRINTTTGSFTVEGTGATIGSGGTVQNITQRGADIQSATNIVLKNMNFTNANTADAGGAGVCDNTASNLSCHAAIYIRNINNIELNNVRVFNTSEQGLNGNVVTGLTMTNCRFSNCGDGQFEGAVKLRDLQGTCLITGSEFDDAFDETVEIFNSVSATALNLSVTNSIFRDNFDNTFGAKGIFIQTLNNVTNNILVDDCDFLRIKTQGVTVFPAAGTANINVTDCIFNKDTKKFMSGVEIVSSGTATANINVLRNTMTVAGGSGITVLGRESSIYQARINNNMITGPNSCSDCVLAGDTETASCNCFGDGIIVWATESSTGKANVVNNTINGIDYSGRGVYANARNRALLNILIQSNTINIAGDSWYNIDVTAGPTDSGFNPTVCAHIQNNATSISGVGPQTFFAHFRNRATSSGSIVNIHSTGTPVATMWNNNLNTPMSPPAIVTSSMATGGTVNFNQTCNYTLTHPSALTMPDNELAKEKGIQNPTHSQSVKAYQTTDNTINTNFGHENSSESPLMMDMVQVGTFTLPAEKNITIRFRVTINDPFPVGVCQVSNQATVSGSNFSDVLTDDPNVAGSADPTITNILVPPAISFCPASATIDPNNANCTSSQTYTATATGCPAPAITYSVGGNPITFPYAFPTGMTEVTVTASNGVGNPATCSFIITVNPPPAVFDVSGGGTRCISGPGFVISLSGSQMGVNYQLVNGVTNVGTPIAGAGTGAAINFPPQSDAGTYTVVGVGPGGCSTTMDGSAVIMVTPLPVSVAGSDAAICGNATHNLSATATNGTGVWSVVSGPSTLASQFSDVMASNAVFTPAGGAGMYLLQWTVSNGVCPDATSQLTVTASTPPSGDAGMDQTICADATATLDATASNGTGTWSVVSGPSTSNTQFSDINSPTAIFTPAGGAGSYQLRWEITAPGCTPVIDFVTIQVNTSTSAIATPAAQSICDGDDITTIVLSSPVNGTTFTWTRNNVTEATGIPASGNGDISGSLSLTGNAPVTVTFTITPTAGTCTGLDIMATVTVYPVREVDQPQNIVVCAGETVPSVVFTSDIPGTSYSWTNNQTSIGLAANGTGNLPSFTAVNTGTTPVTSTITVSPAPTSNVVTFNYTGAIENWTVPAGVTSISITAKGGKGGANLPGLGATIKGNFDVTPGHVLNILTGQAGFSTANGLYGGGGGGTFVWNTSAANNLFMAAGGGGAGGFSPTTSPPISYQGGHGSATVNPSPGSGSGTASGGSDGNGGSGGSTGSQSSGGGGAGWLTNGNNALLGVSGDGGISPLSGGQGGVGRSNFGPLLDISGGFGGGGGTGWHLITGPNQ